MSHPTQGLKFIEIPKEPYGLLVLEFKEPVPKIKEPDHGGKVTVRFNESFIKLANDTDAVSTDDYISARYIEDCVKENKLLSMDDYRLKRRAHSSASDDNVSDISVEDAGSYISINTRGTKGRKKYTHKEDLAMLNYVMNGERYKDINGNVLWKDMEKLEITGHSYQSMKYRFIKSILTNLTDYDVSESWKRKLKGSFPNLVVHNPVNGMDRERGTRKRSVGGDSDIEDELDKHLMEHINTAKKASTPIKTSRVSTNKTSDVVPSPFKTPSFFRNYSKTQPKNFINKMQKSPTNSPRRSQRNKSTKDQEMDDFSPDIEEMSSPDNSMDVNVVETRSSKETTKNSGAEKGPVVTDSSEVAKKNSGAEKGPVVIDSSRVAKKNSGAEKGPVVTDSSRVAKKNSVAEKGPVVTDNCNMAEKNSRAEKGPVVTDSSREAKKSKGAEKGPVMRLTDNVSLQDHNMCLDNTTENKNRNSSVSESDGDSDDDDDDDVDEGEVPNIIEDISSDFGLTRSEAFHLLWINDGDVQETVHFLKKGKLKSGRPIWDIKHDKILKKSGTFVEDDDSESGTEGNVDDLFKIYGKKRVEERLVFLEGL